MNAFEIVPMKEEHLDEVCEIETLSFSYPWKRRQFEEELKISHSLNFLATLDHHGERKVVGYICGWVAADEIHILNLACHPAFRRKGIAIALLNSLLHDARQRNVAVATLEVRRFNTPALELYRKLGFVVKGMRKGYYPEGEDAVIMEMEVGGEALEG